MKKGDKVKVRDGPLAGIEVVLKRRDAANRAWHGRLDYVNDAGARIAGPVLVFDFEFERPVRKGVKHEKGI